MSEILHGHFVAEWWQPIETAPRVRDQPILGCITDPLWPYERRQVVKWIGEGQGWSMPGVSGLRVSHWMALPPVPTTGSNDG